MSGREQREREALRCPICDRAMPLDIERPRERWPAFPFCSARCRALDLGRWIDEEYRVSEPLRPRPPEDEDESLKS